MPEPARRAGRYMPGLDGLRTVAVAAVIAFHLGIGWAPGGLLGVGVFFTLSGYLITDLLLAARDEGRLRLGDFFRRRARRLLPGLYVMLAVVVIWVAIGSRSRLPDVRGQTLSALVYMNNWWQISQHVSYFARFNPPSALGHLWSLAIEEQFYVVWPWLLLLGLRLIPERRRPIKIRPRLAGVTLVLAFASALEMALLFHRGFDNTRIYDGTDTRAFGLLIGAALAMVWPSRSLTGRVTPGARRIIDLCGLAGLAAIVILVWRTNEYSAFMYRGGLVLLSIAAAVVVAAGAHPASRLGRALGCRPLRWIGVRSYGIYLWHQPIIVLTTPASVHHVQALRAAAQVTASVVIAALSWHYIEEPIRRGALGRIVEQARAVRWRPREMTTAVQVALGVGAMTVVLATIGLTGVGPPSISPTAASQTASARAGINLVPAPTTKHSDPSHSSHSSPAAGAHHSHRATGRPRTSCRSVVHIGDSTSEGLTSDNYLPDPSQQIPAQYARVGIRHSDMEITGGTSIIETLPGTTNALTVARDLISHGYQGCWVIALGTNDTADVYVGSSISLSSRIAQMMSVIGNQPVMWINDRSLLSSGPYSEQDMQQFNQALVQACPQHPNMRVYDWASATQSRWFITDGIHYTSAGYAARAHLIANALAEAFPAGGSQPSSCVVHTPTISLPVLGVDSGSSSSTM